jgi:hypothetical protein
MAAVIEIDESNHVAGAEAITHAIPALRAGATDSATAQVPILAGTAAYEKWTRIHVTDLGGASAVDLFTIWAQAPPAEHTFWGNGTTTQVTYDGTKQVTYSAPANTTTRTPAQLPVSQPGGPNLGIGGSLTGQLTAPGYSDYALLQVRPGAAAQAGGTVIVSYGYQIVA